MFVDDCDESSVVSDDGDGKSSESDEEEETCWSIWLSPGGANTSPMDSFRCEE
jgi:hypothetical protein